MGLTLAIAKTVDQVAEQYYRALDAQDPRILSLQYVNDLDMMYPPPLAPMKSDTMRLGPVIPIGRDGKRNLEDLTLLQGGGFVLPANIKQLRLKPNGNLPKPVYDHLSQTGILSFEGVLGLYNYGDGNQNVPFDYRSGFIPATVFVELLFDKNPILLPIATYIEP